MNQVHKEIALCFYKCKPTSTVKLAIWRELRKELAGYLSRKDKEEFYIGKFYDVTEKGV